jgi:hypothetical protein
MEPETLPQENPHKIITLKCEDGKCLSIDQSLLINCWGSTFTKTKEGSDGVIPFAFDSVLFPLLEKALYMVELFKGVSDQENCHNTFLTVLRMPAFNELFSKKPALPMQAISMFVYFNMPQQLCKTLEKYIGYLAGTNNFAIEITRGFSLNDLIMHPNLIRKGLLVKTPDATLATLKRNPHQTLTLNLSRYNLKTINFSDHFSERFIRFTSELAIIDLSHNKLTLISDFFNIDKLIEGDANADELPCLILCHNNLNSFHEFLLYCAHTIDISHNKLTSLPKVAYPDGRLFEFDASNNALTDKSIVNSFLCKVHRCIESVNLAHNQLTTLPANFLKLLNGNNIPSTVIATLAPHVQAAIAAGDAWYKEHASATKQDGVPSNEKKRKFES